MRTSKFRVLHYADDYGPQRWEYLTLPEDIMGESWKDKTAYNWETWGEWIGLTDKHGTEIYEGDIVATPLQWFDEEYNESQGTEKKNRVVKNRGIHLFYAGDWSMSTNEVEVIGNIYENPELASRLVSGH